MFCWSQKLPTTNLFILSILISQIMTITTVTSAHRLLLIWTVNFLILLLQEIAILICIISTFSLHQLPAVKHIYILTTTEPKLPILSATTAIINFNSYVLVGALKTNLCIIIPVFYAKNSFLSVWNAHHQLNALPAIKDTLWQTITAAFCAKQ